MTDAATVRGARWAALVFLILCAPVVVEMLFGAFVVSNLIALVPTVQMYGLAALMIRNVTRRQGGRWLAIIILGVAFTVISECLIVQTSVAPGWPNEHWGRALGVNWTYLVWAMGYISVWGMALSIQLTELVFPAHRARPWLSSRAVGILAAVFALAAVPTWYNWTRGAAPQITHLPVYNPPPITLAVAGLAAGCLVVAGWHLAHRPPRPRVALDRPAPTPTGVAVVAFLVSVAWFALLIPSATKGAIAHVRPTLAIAFAIIVAARTAIVVHDWSRTRTWGDQHRLALITGALTASMAVGFMANQLSPADLAGKIVLNVAALLGLLLLARRYRSRPRQPIAGAAPATP